MRGLLLLLFMATCFTVAFSATKEDAHHISLGGTLELKFLGSADGKSFFYEKTVNRTWAEAGEFCTSTGMHLASFDTRTQMDVIVNSSNEDFQGDCYWTSARDSTSYSHFTWNDTETAVDVLDNRFAFNLPYRNCVNFCINSVGTNVFVANPCELELYTLCET